MLTSNGADSSNEYTIGSIEGLGYGQIMEKFYHVVAKN